MNSAELWPSEYAPFIINARNSRSFGGRGEFIGGDRVGKASDNLAGRFPF